MKRQSQRWTFLAILLILVAALGLLPAVLVRHYRAIATAEKLDVVGGGQRIGALPLLLRGVGLAIAENLEQHPGQNRHQNADP